MPLRILDVMVDDIAELLKYSKIDNADCFGVSNGCNTAMQIAIRYPNLVQKIILDSAFFKRDGLYLQVWDSLNQSTLTDMPQLLKDAYTKVAPDSGDLSRMYEKDKKRMMEFEDWKTEDIRSINTPVLIIVGDKDVVHPEHAVEMIRILPHARLSILLGKHGSYTGEVISEVVQSKMSDLVVSIIEEFLNELV